MDFVSFDLETHAFGLRNMAPRPVCLSWAFGRGGCLIVGFDEIGRWLAERLATPGLGLCGHAVSYDMACMLEHFPALRSAIWQAYGEDRIACTMLREQLLDIASGEFKGNSGYSLGKLAGIAKGADTWRTRYAELDGVSLDLWPAEAKTYAITDATETLSLFHQQESRAARIGYDMPTQFAEARADFALRLTSNWGIEIDQEQAQHTWNESCARAQALVGELEAANLVIPRRAKNATLFDDDDLALEIPDVRKNLKLVRELIVKHYPGEPPKTPKGLVATDKDVIRACDFEPFRILSEFESIRKAVNTYLSKLLFAPVIHARFFAVGTPSDRTACQSPNMQNQPRVPGIRECFVPRAGHLLLAADYDAQEMRTLAQSALDITGRSRLAERFQANKHFDPHLEFAAALAKISIDEAKRRHREHDAEIKGLRQQSKAANFGYPGGMGPDTFLEYAKGYGVDLTLAESRDLKERWFQAWPEMEPYFAHASSVVGNAGYGTMTIPRSGFRRAGVGYCDCSNGYFQTLAAHASKGALFDVARACFQDRDSYLYGSRPVVFVHDEIILETPAEAGHEAGQALVEVMEAAQNRWTPDVPASASATLMRRWSKGADACFDEKGRLIPWEPNVDSNGGAHD